MTDNENMILLLGEELEREIWLTQKRGLIQGIGWTANEDNDVSLLDVLYTIKNDPPINQEYLYKVIVLTFITELIKGSYYGVINEGSPSF
jgi:hypothetical protein